jgi:putative flippase GtrA
VAVVRVRLPERARIAVTMPETGDPNTVTHGVGAPGTAVQSVVGNRAARDDVLADDVLADDTVDRDARAEPAFAPGMTHRGTSDQLATDHLTTDQRTTGRRTDSRSRAAEVDRSPSPTTYSGPAASSEAGRAMPARGLVGRVHAAMDVVYREMVKFGAIGALAYVVDTYVYNVLRTGLWPLHEAPLAHKPLMSKVVSVAVATVVAWLGNRYWTFRHRRRATMRSEFVLFVVMNVGGLVIALGCLWFSHYVLGLTSVLADNISGNVVGLVLGTLFRFWAYRQFVFTELRAPVTHVAPSAE